METLESYWEQLRLTTLAEGEWVIRNLGLALIPLALALVLFLPDRRRTPVWWAGVAVFLAFLPNAPYVLADVTWFLRDVRWVEEEVAVFALMPLYALFFLAGFTAYATSLLLMRRHLHGRAVSAWAVAAHAISAVGIYLGRAYDLNSWDVATAPGRVLEAVWESVAAPRRLGVIVLIFGGLALGTPAYQWLLRAAANQWRRRTFTEEAELSRR